MKKIDLPVESFVGGWYVPDEKICDDLVQFFEDNVQQQVPGKLYHNGEHTVKKEWKDSIDIGMDLYWDISQRYIRQLDFVLKEYKELYRFCDETPAWNVSAMNIQKYNPGGGYSVWHNERSSGHYPQAARHLVFMTFLNDVYEEGYTEFYYQGVAVKPRKGLTLIWPVDWTHTHRGVRAPKETKYIITGWLSFVDIGIIEGTGELKG